MVPGNELGMKTFLSRQPPAVPAMWGFASKEEIQQLEQNTKQSFASVRADTQNVYDWLNFLYRQNQELQQSIDAQNALLQRTMTPEQVRHIIDSHYSFEPILERVRAMENRIENIARLSGTVGNIERQQHDVFEQLKKLHSQVETLGNDRRQTHISREPGNVGNVTEPRLGTTSALAEKMVKMAVRNSKDMIKQSILNLIRMHGQVSGVALRESIVVEQGLCSKSSFYRMLEELEDSDEITVVDEGKEKRYFWSAARAKKHARDD